VSAAAAIGLPESVPICIMKVSADGARQQPVVGAPGDGRQRKPPPMALPSVQMSGVTPP
jgi:hypothetical protein